MDVCNNGFVNFKNNVKVNQSHYRPELPSWSQEVKVPRLRDNGPGGKVVSLTHRPICPQEMLLVLISVRG